MTKPLRK